MIIKGIGSTTQIDAHNMQMSKECLDKAAHDINTDKYAPSFGIEHDITVFPLGKVYKAYVDRLGETDYALHIEQEIYDNISTATINGEKYVMVKSNVDDRPFASDKIERNDKFMFAADPVNFESTELLSEYFEELKSEYEIDTQIFCRKSVIPDPELVFQFLEESVKYLLIYLSSKQVIERVGTAFVDKTLNEIGGLYNLVKKAIITGSKYLIPKNRPVTYVFKGNLDYIVELIVKTKNPDTALGAISKENLKDAIDKIDNVIEQFPNLCRVQLVYNEYLNKWEFNYLTTEKGEIIGTEVSYNKSAKQTALYLENIRSLSISTSTQPNDVL